MNRITVERIDGDFKQEWIFWLDRWTLWLDRYQELSRPTKRHKFLPESVYDRCDDRNNTIDRVDVPLPDDVCIQAKQEIFRRLEVKLWDK